MFLADGCLVPALGRRVPRQKLRFGGLALAGRHIVVALLHSFILL